MIRRLEYWLRVALFHLLRLYQRTISPVLPPSCRFEPSCSHYALEVLQTWPLAPGLWLIIKRLARCQPFCKSGFDPVPESPASAGHRFLEVKSLGHGAPVVSGRKRPRGAAVARCLERDNP